MKIVLFGEYLLRLTAPSHEKLSQASQLQMHWAGSEANIAVSLSLLGDSPLYVTCLPENELAKAGLSELKKHNVATHEVWKDGRVGIYFYEAGNSVRNGKVLYDRAYSSFSKLNKEDMDWDVIFEDANWFHWSGITAGLCEASTQVLKQALHKAREKGLTISADFNYRNTLWNYGKHCNEVMPELLSLCDVLLADVNSAKLYFGIEPGNENLVADTMLLLQKRLPAAKYISMTMRTRLNHAANIYQGFLWHNAKLYNSSAYNINHVIERIGSGDAFMAGLLYALRKNKSMQDVIEFATAAGVIKHGIIGDFNLAFEDDMYKLIQYGCADKIIR